jgi:hypothetical protein
MSLWWEVDLLLTYGVFLLPFIIVQAATSPLENYKVDTTPYSYLRVQLLYTKYWCSSFSMYTLMQKKKEIVYLYVRICAFISENATLVV